MSESPAIMGFCDVCSVDRGFTRVTQTGTYTVRGQAVTADLPMIACLVCGALQPDPDDDCMVAIYKAYERATGLAHPDLIVKGVT